MNSRSLCHHRGEHPWSVDGRRVVRFMQLAAGHEQRIVDGLGPIQGAGMVTLHLVDPEGGTVGISLSYTAGREEMFFF